MKSIAEYMRLHLATCRMLPWLWSATCYPPALFFAFSCRFSPAETHAGNPLSHTWIANILLPTFSALLNINKSPSRLSPLAAPAHHDLPGSSMLNHVCLPFFAHVHAAVSCLYAEEAEVMMQLPGKSQIFTLPCSQGAKCSHPLGSCIGFEQEARMKDRP